MTHEQIGGSCEYFTSEDWAQRVLAVVDRVWSLPESLERLDIDDPATVLQTHADTYGLDPADLSITPVTDLLDRDTENVLPVTDDDIRTHWINTRSPLPITCRHDATDGSYCLSINLQTKLAQKPNGKSFSLASTTPTDHQYLPGAALTAST